MEQLIMRWKNDHLPIKEISLDSEFTVKTFLSCENALNQWLDLMQYGLSDGRPDEDFYRRAMSPYKNYSEDKCFFIMCGKLAVATLTVICDYEKKEGYIHMVCCHGNYRGRGLGSALNDIAVKVLKEEGMETACLTTDDFRIPAIKSYLRVGFTADLSTDDFKKRWAKIFEEINK